MNNNIFLNGDTAQWLYSEIKSLPIADYHCHLSPKEIFEDKPFESLSQLWLAHDHYKWRLMRESGIDEYYITGEANGAEKLSAFAKAVELAAGNPLYHWTMFELKRFFGIDELLTSETADDISKRADEIIKSKKLSPRKILQSEHVAALATTDDPADTLEYHLKLKGFDTAVTPTFRADNLVSVNSPSYPQYIKRLSAQSNIEIMNYDSLKKAVSKRLDDFCAAGCRISDVGIEEFPDGECSDTQADEIFRRAVNSVKISREELRKFLSSIYLFLASEYKKRGMTMQLHLNVMRNTNTALFESAGADCGCDAVSDPVPIKRIAGFFDRAQSLDSLPNTIIYTLNPAAYMPLAVCAGSFKNISLGAAWWFNDHKSGIEKQLEIFSQTGNISKFSGMLTDSRSFLSYTRHDYFRRIFCSFLGKKIDSGEFPDKKAALKICRKVCFENSLKLLKGE